MPVLPTLLIPQGAPDAEGRLDGCGWDDVVIKPAVDGGARETLRAQRSSAAARGHTARLAAAGDVVVQPYAAGVEAGETSLLFFGGEFSHAVRKVPAQGDYRVQAHHGGTEHRHEPTSLELETSQLAMSCAPGPLTYARVDLVEVDGVPTLMELEVIEPDRVLPGRPRVPGPVRHRGDRGTIGRDVVSGRAWPCGRRGHTCSGPCRRGSEDAGHRAT